MHRWFFALVCLLAGWAGAAPNGDIWRALLDSPPSVHADRARDAAVGALDKWLEQPNSEQSPECVAYYRQAVDRVIHLLRTERPKKHVRVFQLYSSSVVVQTPSCVFAIDLDQGPNENLHQTPEEEGVAFCMTDFQVGALADLVDCSFHTHEHADHIDYEISQALLARGKTLVAPESAKDIWAGDSWAGKIVTPLQTLGEGTRIGNLVVDVLWDHQWNNDAHSSGTPCNAYVITTPEGITVATKGDINCGLRFYGWLHLLKEKGRRIDFMVGSPIYWHGVSPIREIDALFKPVWLPGHNWEFVHRKSGEARGHVSTYTLSETLLRSACKRGRSAVLSWGEYLDK